MLDKSNVYKEKMQTLLFWTLCLIGPCYLVFLLALLLARRFFPETQVPFELTEPMLMIGAGILALAIAGVMAQIG